MAVGAFREYFLALAGGARHFLAAVQQFRELFFDVWR